MGQKIKWAERVSRDKIKRLYESDANLMLDENLLQEIGYAFIARCESILAINKLFEYHILTCPSCGKDINQNTENRNYICGCGWSITEEDLKSTYQRKQLSGLTLNEYANNFIADWNRALNDPKKQMIAVDYLIHRFHWEMTENPTRPVAVNYIEGSMDTVTQLIFDLAYGDTDEKQKNFDHWKKVKAKADSIWVKQ
ncbi:MAG: hypothetical protein FWD71_10870 [Oscillospiraceae bacterium]|nr:hypothetical protein [Oscillospiraceae bacterium]